jgi:hypothetical protein
MPEAMVERFLAWSQGRAEEALRYFNQLAIAAAEAEAADPQDALEQRRIVHIEEVERGVSDDPESRRYPRDDVEWADVEWDSLDAWLEGSLDEAAGLDVTLGALEDWHVLDEDDTPLWEAQQPAHYRVLLERVQWGETLDALKTLGQKGYAASWFTRAQLGVFWSLWQVRKDAVLEELSRWDRPLAKAVRRIQSANGDLPLVGRRLYQPQHQHPQRYTAEQWSVLWATYHRQQATGQPVSPSRR